MSKVFLHKLGFYYPDNIFREYSPRNFPELPVKLLYTFLIEVKFLGDV